MRQTTLPLIALLALTGGSLKLVAAIQGTALLTSSFRDPEIMTRQAHRLARWIDEESRWPFDLAAGPRRYAERAHIGGENGQDSGRPSQGHAKLRLGGQSGPAAILSMGGEDGVGGVDAGH